MSIDIVCYTSINIDELRGMLSAVKKKYDYLFDGSYLMFEPHSILTYQQLNLIEDRVQKYNHETKLLIANEFGLKEPRSYFLIAVNDKSFSQLNPSEIANMFREELGEEKIILLLNGEHLI